MVRRVLLSFALLALSTAPVLADGDPAEPPALGKTDAKNVARWIDDLDAADYATRLAATEALRAFGAGALPGLRTAAAEGSSPETRARARLLVLVLEAGLEDPETSDGAWITLKGDMGRTGARGEAPGAGIRVAHERGLGGGAVPPTEALDAPLAVADGWIVAARADRLTVMRADDLGGGWELGLGRRVTASPVVSGGRVFVGTSRGLSAWDLATRREVWSVDAAYGVGAAPLASGATLYACLGDDAVVALDAATGARRWRHACRAGTAAPVLVDGRIVVGTADGRVLALNATTGDVAWSETVDGSLTFSPAVVAGTVIIGDNGRRLRCLDAATGTLLWERSVQGRFTGDGPAVSSRAIVFATSRHEVEAYDPATGRRLWRRWLGTLHISSPVQTGRLVLFGSRTNLIAVDAATGDDVWRIDLDAEVACPLVTGETVYALAGRRLIALR